MTNALNFTFEIKTDYLFYFVDLCFIFSITLHHESFIFLFGSDGMFDLFRRSRIFG